MRTKRTIEPESWEQFMDYNFGRIKFFSIIVRQKSLLKNIKEGRKHYENVENCIEILFHFNYVRERFSY